MFKFVRNDKDDLDQILIILIGD